MPAVWHRHASEIPNQNVPAFRAWPSYPFRGVAVGLYRLRPSPGVLFVLAESGDSVGLVTSLSRTSLIARNRSVTHSPDEMASVLNLQVVRSLRRGLKSCTALTPYCCGMYLRDSVG
jgi:hypothetical protein